MEEHNIVQGKRRSRSELISLGISRFVTNLFLILIFVSPN